MADLAGKELRASYTGIFSDDPSRMLRMVRLKHRLGFNIEARTASLMRAVDQMIERFSPSPDLTDAAKEKRFKVVEGMVAMISQGIDAQAETIRAGEREGR